jgi:uncharacterized protein (TIGR00299 family) protein
VAKGTVIIDVATAGASGDMFLSALIDLVGDDQAIVPVAASLLIYDPRIRVKVVTKLSDDIAGRQLEIRHDSSIRLTPASIVEVTESVAEELELSDMAKSFALNVVNQILEAESRAHEKPVAELTLHETGSVDTILDIVGTAYLLEKANLLEDTIFLSTTVAVGSGTITTEHGELEVPVPAVAEIIVANDMKFHMGDAKTEVLTPTGAAILACLAKDYIESTEGFLATKQGVGFGSRDLGKIPNSLKILVGEMEEPKKKPKKKKSPKTSKSAKPKKPVSAGSPSETPIDEERIEVFEGWNADEVIVIETNVDDVDGEVMGNLFDTLLAEGLAYDVVMIPAYGKKNRPCFVVKVIAPTTGLKSIAEIMIKHLGTLGIRYQTWSRFKALRETIVCKLEIDEQEFMVRVKVSRSLDGSIVSIKPEADDVMLVARATGIPIRELKPRIAMQAHAITE